MDLSNNENQKRKKFRDILMDLSDSFEYLKDEKTLKKIISELELLYLTTLENGKTFRHYYSDIYSIIPIITKEQDKDRLGALAYNVYYLKEQYPSKKDEKCDISSQLNKLFDHITLEYARINNNTYENWKNTSEGAINKLEGKINEVESKLENFQIDTDKVKSKLENIQKDYVGILSIFAAVIVAFTAGTAFSSSVLNNINNITIYRLIFTCLLLGGILINVLYVLFCFILIIVKGKKLSITACLLPNSIIGILLFFTGIAWYNGFVEKRNEHVIINEKQQNYNIILDNNLKKQIETNTKEKKK